MTIKCKYWLQQADEEWCGIWTAEVYKLQELQKELPRKVISGRNTP
ncbi:MAG: hypothetical protein MRQ09_06470 [Candidatus Midichloria sp.]|nr:hypothetical protein [Candidatus Midichloria sp.]